MGGIGRPGEVLVEAEAHLSVSRDLLETWLLTQLVAHTGVPGNVQLLAVLLLPDRVELPGTQRLRTRSVRLVDESRNDEATQWASTPPRAGLPKPSLYAHPAPEPG